MATKNINADEIKTDVIETNATGIPGASGSDDFAGLFNMVKGIIKNIPAMTSVPKTDGEATTVTKTTSRDVIVERNITLREIGKACITAFTDFVLNETNNNTKRIDADNQREYEIRKLEKTNEFTIRMKELELKEREIALKEKEFEARKSTK